MTELVAGRYRLLERIGAGGMGVVWRAFDERLERVVALKRLVVPEGANAEEAARRAAREARIAARLHHPNAVTVHDAVTDDGVPVLVMEYVAARPLSGVVLPPEHATRVGAQVADALAAAHAAGIVHRDVKPANILLTDDGTAKITDFGIARAFGDVAVTRTGVLAGTPAFLSPEVARGAEPGPPADVFALGSTLYALVEGRPPFGDGDNAIALLHAVAAGQFPPPARAGALTGVLLDLLRTDPSTRPTMAEAAHRLRALATGVAGPLTGTPAPLPVPTRVDLGPAPRLHTGPQASPGTRLDTGSPPSGTRLGPALPPSRPAGRGWVVAAAVAVVGVVVVAAVLLGRGDGTPAATSTKTATPTVATTTTPAVDAAALERAVAEYYALLPKKTDQAWERLGPGMRAKGRQQYEKSWEDVKDFAVTTAPRADSATTVTVGVQYERHGRVREAHRVTLVVQDGTPLIENVEVLSSQRAPKDGGKGDKDDKDDE